jgi:hypothetical protein
MKDLTIGIALLLLSACGSRSGQNPSQFDNPELDSPKNRRLANGLVMEMRGEWINTSLFDSTITQKKLNKWIWDFYGDLHLVIDESDSITIEGNMDGGDCRINLIDSTSFSLPCRIDTPHYKYSFNRNLIYSVIGSNDTIVFRKVNKDDKLDIIANEEYFNKFFIDKLFTNEYFKEQKKPDFIELWDGFETFTPFTFDAVAIKFNEDSIYYLSWQFKNDTLELYNTSYKYDEDSGFRIYKIEDLNSVYIKK